MLQATGHPSEIPGILPAISAGYRGTFLVVKGVWLVMYQRVEIVGHATLLTKIISGNVYVQKCKA